LWRNEAWDTLNNPYFSPHQKLDGDENDPASYQKYKANDYAQDMMAKEALNFIRDNKDSTFFLYLPFPVPHVALQVPDEALKQYSGKLDTIPYKGEKGYLPHPEPRAAYAAMITRMDEHIGQILDLLVELKIDDNTIIFFTSDNGTTFAGGVEPEFFNSTGELRGLKMSLYEGGIRVPLVVCWPEKIKAGTTSDHISAFQDVLPTIMDITGGELPADIDGLSFLPTLKGEEEQKEHEYLYWEFHTWGGFQTVRKGKWKAIRKKVDEYPNSPVELYDLSTDIGEQYDVSDKFPEVIEEMVLIMDQARSPSEYFPFVNLDGF
jgi:arylsulfatase